MTCYLLGSGSFILLDRATFGLDFNQLKQCFGSVSFLSGSGSSDPFRGITDTVLYFCKNVWYSCDFGKFFVWKFSMILSVFLLTRIRFMKRIQIRVAKKKRIRIWNTGLKVQVIDWLGVVRVRRENISLVESIGDLETQLDIQTRAVHRLDKQRDTL